MGESNNDAKHTPTPDEMGAKCARLFFSRGYSAGGLAPMREHQLATVCSSAITLATLELSNAHSALVAQNEALVAALIRARESISRLEDTLGRIAHPAIGDPSTEEGKAAIRLACDDCAEAEALLPHIDAALKLARSGGGGS